MRRAEFKDLQKIMEIIADAKASLKLDGINQWQNGVPNQDMVENDISHNNGYVFEEDEEVLAYAFLKEEEEKDYLIAEDKFKYKNYFTVHRYCVDGKKRHMNIATRFFEEIKEWGRKNSFEAIRIDTHQENMKMRRFIQKMEFSEVGMVYIDDNGISKERIAYELKL